VRPHVAGQKSDAEKISPIDHRPVVRICRVIDSGPYGCVGMCVE